MKRVVLYSVMTLPESAVRILLTTILRDNAKKDTGSFLEILVYLAQICHLSPLRKGPPSALIHASRDLVLPIWLDWRGRVLTSGRAE